MSVCIRRQSYISITFQKKVAQVQNYEIPQHTNIFPDTLTLIEEKVRNNIEHIDTENNFPKIA